MEIIKQNWKNVHILFRFLVSFSGFVFQENESQNSKPKKTKPSTTPEIKTRAPQNCARVLSPAFYLLQGHKPGTGNAARVLYDRDIFNLVHTKSQFDWSILVNSFSLTHSKYAISLVFRMMFESINKNMKFILVETFPPFYKK